MSNTIRHYYNAACTSASNYSEQKAKDAVVWLYNPQKWTQVAKGIACFMGEFALETFVLYQAEKWGLCPVRKVLKEVFSPIPAHEWEKVNKVAVGIGGIFATFYICILAPCLEEIIFRDIVQKNILGASATPPVPAKKTVSKCRVIATKIAEITITAGLFSLAHYGAAGPSKERRIFHHISTFAMGIGFGITREICGLFPAIINHSMRNLTAMLATFLLRYPTRAFSLLVIPPILFSAYIVKKSSDFTRSSIRSKIAQIQEHPEYVQTYQDAISNLQKLKGASLNDDRSKLKDISDSLLHVLKSLNSSNEELPKAIDNLSQEKVPLDEGLDKLILAAQKMLNYLISLQTVDKDNINTITIS